MLRERKIAILGLGKIGGALASSLVRNKIVSKENIVGTTGHRDSALEAAKRYGIKTLTDNVRALADAQIVILAVKPQTMKKVLLEIRDAVRDDQLIITLAAARTTRFIEEYLQKAVPVVRAMTNTPCLVNAGMTVLCPGRYASKEHIELAREIFAAVGLVAIIDNEELMDAVTALSGSGPAYAYIMIEALAEGGVKVGLPRSLSTILAAQSLLGAAKMVLETGEHPAKLKDEVTTPAGVTIDGIMALEDGGIRVTLIKTVDRATEKSKELSQ
ncbi:MAG: pyrroline-5-carboxylate reductase [Candidatus Bipolaricaulota bacterium]|nr:pyrroline-5-carboxylate reductase [Candidatus Bipolaricaulota bacterium]MDW8031709.1 pyrroline-5-carboxylate reductase [Candidatus Bipolaricaulota bacterium]